jgi:hypothetical protein
MGCFSQQDLKFRKFSVVLISEEEEQTPGAGDRGNGEHKHVIELSNFTFTPSASGYLLPLKRGPGRISSPCSTQKSTCLGSTLVNKPMYTYTIVWVYIYDIQYTQYIIDEHADCRKPLPLGFFPPSFGRCGAYY